MLANASPAPVLGSHSSPGNDRHGRNDAFRCVRPRDKQSNSSADDGG
jgi:hypothetical protein